MAISRKCDNCGEYFSVCINDKSRKKEGYNRIYLQRITDGINDVEIGNPTQDQFDICPKCAEAIHMALLNRVKEVEKNGNCENV